MKSNEIADAIYQPKIKNLEATVDGLKVEKRMGEKKVQDMEYTVKVGGVSKFLCCDSTPKLSLVVLKSPILGGNFGFFGPLFKHRYHTPPRFLPIHAKSTSGRRMGK